jgi:hypothetical protein
MERRGVCAFTFYGEKSVIPGMSRERAEMAWRDGGVIFGPGRR